MSANVVNVMWQRVITLKARLGELTVIVSSAGNRNLRLVRTMDEATSIDVVN